MKRDSTVYTFLFAMTICVVCSFLLAAVSEGLRSRKEQNVAIDKKRNILKAVNLETPLGAKPKPEEILSVYEQKIEEMVINSSGQVVKEMTPADVEEGSDLHPLYIYKEGGAVKAYAFPIVGKGLWSTLRGYFALEPDAKTVRGITFYEHGETPGLGAEIEKDWFQNNFKGKKIWDADAQALRPVEVIKGKVSEKIKDQKAAQYAVDGISGATMTSKGVSAMVDHELRVYEPYFSNIRSGSAVRRITVGALSVQ